MTRFSSCTTKDGSGVANQTDSRALFLKVFSKCEFAQTEIVIKILPEVFGRLRED